MRRHGSYKRRSEINEALPLAQEPLPRVLRDEPGSAPAPQVDESQALPLMRGEVGLEFVAEEGGPSDPINNEPMS